MKRFNAQIDGNVVRFKDSCPAMETLCKALGYQVTVEREELRKQLEKINENMPKHRRKHS